MPVIKKGLKRAIWQNEPKKYINRNSKIYNSKKHKIWRSAILTKNPICVECQKRGKIVEAKEADHITPIEQGGEPYDLANGQGLCKSCHSKKTAKENNQ